MSRQGSSQHGNKRKLEVARAGEAFVARFQAMGSPCELLCEVDAAATATELGEIVAAEAWRIEDKFSRYIPGNIIDRINTAKGLPIDVDAETAQLLDFAATLYQLSDGAFDISSGVLRRAWVFDGGDQVPTKEAVRSLMALVGWQKVRWERPRLTLPADMEIDLGGIGKEYGVDRAVIKLQEHCEVPCLVNFGGDLAVTAKPQRRSAWTVGIEANRVGRAETSIQLAQGAIATSGDRRRFLKKNGRRYSHVLDARTGWPVENAAASISVAADRCTEAGMLATLAMQKGAGAESFLEGEGRQFWCFR